MENKVYRKKLGNLKKQQVTARVSLRAQHEQ